MGWNCEACSYRNVNDTAGSCFICETTREKKAKAKSSGNVAIVGKASSNAACSDNAKKRKTGSQTTLSGNLVDEKASAAKASKKPRAAISNAAKMPASSTTTKVQTTLSLGLVPSGYGPISSDSYTDKATRCRKVLRDVFKIEKLRNQQPRAVECALKGHSQIIVMATGGGKSLCYQLPAVVIGGTTIVISPLIALMKDQVQALTKKGISAACVNSSNKESENNQILSAVLGRNLNTTTNTKKTDQNARKPINLLYVTPESLGTSRMQNILNELHKKNRLAGFAIDEAHCISSYGHDFRPAYRKLDYIRNQFPDLSVMALTATASPAVLKDIKKNLKLERAPCHVGSFDRPNIFYKVHYKDGLDSIAEGGSLADLAKFVKKQHRRAAKENNECSGLVYVHKKADTTFLAKELTKRTQLQVGAYNGGMKPADRTKVQEDWLSGKVQCCVATVALGMGIDLAHVRYVVHWSIPKTMDGFYQESGRAGRDGLPAISLVYFSRDDANLFSFLIRKEAEKRQGKNGGAADNAEATQRKLDALECVVGYCTTASCRRHCVLKYFGEKDTDPKTICQKSCDVCQNPEKMEKAISAAESMRALSKQKQMAKTTKEKNRWNGQWTRPHGDGDGEDWDGGRQEDWEVEGLGITGEAKAPKSIGSGSFVSAASRLDSLARLEAKEREEGAKEEYGGFVKFKASSARRDRDPFPEHIRLSIQSAIDNKQKSKPKEKEQSSADLKASAEKIRAELAEIEAKKAALKARSSSVVVPAALPPPPPVSFKQRRRKP
ncbi:Probable Werner syndrome ATP-dependent helicase homolog 1 [Seminavis robusta]|uniref:ATP-dependent DNA helicase n=1 Tax=Seminavis robusta TaxID=568900 RepID=A0A9N8E1B4_9STRA|nr:Probable Werner syndrome ATP-dependent helicase homolog 1 [Seminavis robusta]|eukprot:Sro408_g136820.1 Probable Werner syndrome ATP-dependent helicase homolog 1 (780) ;mRNA; f:4585-7478